MIPNFGEINDCFENDSVSNSRLILVRLRGGGGDIMKHKSKG